jgi:hypothetical protein
VDAGSGLRMPRCGQFYFMQRIQDGRPADVSCLAQYRYL